MPRMPARRFSTERYGFAGTCVAIFSASFTCACVKLARYVTMSRFCSPAVKVRSNAAASTSGTAASTSAMARPVASSFGRLPACGREVKVQRSAVVRGL